MAANQFVIGSEIGLKATFKNENKALTDPTTVTFRVRRPDDTIEVFVYPAAGTERLSLGVFRLRYTPAEPGNYTWRVEGTGNVIRADESAFEVLDSAVLDL